MIEWKDSLIFNGKSLILSFTNESVYNLKKNESLCSTYKYSATQKKRRKE